MNTLFNENVNSDLLISKLKEINNRMSDCLADFAEISAEIGIDLIQNEKSKNDDGVVLSVQDIINACEIDNKNIRLPKFQINKKVYSEVKKTFENAGASWVGGKTQAFVFPFVPDRVMDELKKGNYINLQQDYQFFETPDDLADWIVSLADIKETDLILEPSAGRGAIIKAIHSIYPSLNVDCYELMPENREYLLQMPCVSLMGLNFINDNKEKKYNKIIANPPFSNNQDIIHIRKMYDILEDGGRLVAISGTGYKFRQDKVAIEFREWLASVYDVTYMIEKGKFKKSGTNIETCVIIINK